MPRSEYDHFLEALTRKRAPAVSRAEDLLAEDRYDEAEQAIFSVDSSIYGAVAIAKMYRERLESLVADGIDPGTRPRIKEVFRHALRAAQGAYPEPHTALEAEDYSKGRDEDRAELVRILGYDPDEM